MQSSVALVTGGGGAGTGRAVSRRLAAGGAAVVVADIDVEAALETVRAVEADGGRAAFVRADVTSEADVAATIAFAAETFGGLDVLVNSAGGTPDPHFPDAPAEHWGRTLDLNLRGPMVAIQHALPLLARRGGAVVNIASVAGLGFRPAVSPEYAAAKAGLIRLTAALGRLAADQRVRVNCVVPDWIRTPSIAARYPQGGPGLPERMTTPDEIAGAVADLIADDALAGRVLVCWCDGPWALIADGDDGYREFTVRSARALGSTGPRPAAG
ncbi:MAG TPA: SDR family oxidoreductase [Candidatus Dormibacteraeota bacterium]|nr:SDR family oxidoreductase [Candidatus Dormibacteraeota bacterium]